MSHAEYVKRRNQEPTAGDVAGILENMLFRARSGEVVAVFVSVLLNDDSAESVCSEASVKLVGSVHCGAALMTASINSP